MASRLSSSCCLPVLGLTHQPHFSFSKSQFRLTVPAAPPLGSLINSGISTAQKRFLQIKNVCKAREKAIFHFSFPHIISGITNDFSCQDIFYLLLPSCWTPTTTIPIKGGIWGALSHFPKNTQLEPQSEIQAN